MALADGERPRVPPRRPALLAVVAASLLGAAGARAPGRPDRRAAAPTAELADRAAAALPLATASLAAVIEKQRLMPMVLARDPEVIALLAGPTSRRASRLDDKLAEIAARGRRRGDLPGRPRRHRDRRQQRRHPAELRRQRLRLPHLLHRRRWPTGTAQQYALGTVSGRPGPLPVPAGRERASGRSASSWSRSSSTTSRRAGARAGSSSRSPTPTASCSPTTDPAWRFGTTRPLADEAAARARAPARRRRSRRRRCASTAPGQARSTGAPFVFAAAPVGAVGAGLDARRLPARRAGARHGGRAARR